MRWAGRIINPTMKEAINTIHAGIRIITSIVLIVTIILVSGCDWSASWDMRRAEKALKRADKVNAEFWAGKEYGKAQKAFELAQDLARVRKVNEARDKALEAYEWAQEAEFWAIIKAEEMEKERESLNSKKY